MVQEFPLFVSYICLTFHPHQFQSDLDWAADPFFKTKPGNLLYAIIIYSLIGTHVHLHCTHSYNYLKARISE